MKAIDKMFYIILFFTMMVGYNFYIDPPGNILRESNMVTASMYVKPVEQIKKPVKTGKTKFFDDLYKYYVKVKDKAVLPSVCLAQCALESCYGKSSLSTKANNYLGIKGSYKGQYVRMLTKEFKNGQFVDMMQPFRKYPNVYHCIEDYHNILKLKSYKYLKSATTYKQQINALKVGGYATDPKYINKIIQIIEKYNLSYYDEL